MKVYNQLIHNGKVHSTHTHAIRNTRKEAKVVLSQLETNWKEISPNPVLRRTPLVLEVLIFEGIGTDGTYSKVVSRYSNIAKK